MLQIAGVRCVGPYPMRPLAGFKGSGEARKDKEEGREGKGTRAV